MTVSIVAAVAFNGVIGVGGKLPWRMPEDLQRFKRLTMGKPVIMGRKTWESIGRPLPGRFNIVVTRNSDYRAEGAEVCNDLQSAIALAKDSVLDTQDEVMVIGGGEIYEQAMPRADKIYLTTVCTEVEGDTYFTVPRYWVMAEREFRPQGINEFSSVYELWVRPT